jgi:amino acid adenylation domain-containing protein
MECSIGAMKVMLGILRAGGAYLPLDPGHPRERLRFVLEDAGAGLVLAQPEFRSLFAEQPRVIIVDDEGEWLKREQPATAGVCGIPPRATDLAYVIYTSGSTGRPKGVAMPHAPLVNLLEWHLAYLPGLGRTLQFAPLGFDVSFQEIFSTWTAGGTLVLAPGETRRDPGLLWNFVAREEIERLFLPCVALEQLASAARGSQAPRLREIITAGEQLRITPAITALFENNRHCTLHNHYGPTETHVVTSFTLGGAPGDWPLLPPIGKPITNASVEILDADLGPVPPGETGEICISGACLARGYLNRTDLTAGRFVQRSKGLLYKTGDVGRLLSSGDIAFLGRSDGQVKIRGYRVEPGEIETALLQYPDVSQCVVTSAPGAGGGLRLVAHVVPKPGSRSIGSDQLAAFLKKGLPDYMIPTAFALLDAMPLTASGKTDRRALPLPGQPQFHAMPRSGTGAVLPASNSAERKLIAIWERLLDLRPIGPRENFFDLGGHSLLVMQLADDIEREFGKRITPAVIFHSPTVEDLAAALDGVDATDHALPVEKIRATGANTPFFCMPGLLDLSRHLGAEQPCYGLPMPGLDDEDGSWMPVEEIAAGCIRNLRTAQHHGPYTIGGYSFGGVVAFEIARQLAAAGETVSLLVLIEPDPPAPFRTSGLAFHFSRAIFHGRKIAEHGVRKRMGYLLDRFQKKRARSGAPGGYSEAKLENYMLRTDAIHSRYQAAPFPGKAVMFLARDTVWRVRPGKDPRLDWGGFIDDLKIHEIPGDHTTVIREPGVREMARYLAAHLENASRRTDKGGHPAPL